MSFKTRIHSDFRIILDQVEHNLLSFMELDDNRTWVKDVISFIEDWMNEKDHLEVSTSGSTGDPKTLSIRKDQMVTSARATLDFLRIDPGESALLCMSVQFIGGKMMVVRSMIGGLKLIVREPTSHPLRQEDERIGFAAMVPLQVIGSIPELGKLDRLIIGGAPISQGLSEALSRIKDCQIYQTFGMTETISHVAMRQLAPRMEKEYHALPGITFSSDAAGCLVIHAKGLGHWALVTNDMVCLNGPQSFEWLGRRDHVINSGGIKVHPEKVEEELRTTISDPFFIAGWPDGRLGEMVVLCVEGEPRTLSIPEELPKYKRPKKVIFMDGFARTETGKIRRKETLSRVHPSQFRGI